MRILPTVYLNGAGGTTPTVRDQQDAGSRDPEPISSSVTSGVTTSSTVVPTNSSLDGDIQNLLLEFKDLAEEMQATKYLSELCEWDMRTHMPEKGTEARGWQVGQLSKIHHRALTSEKMETLLKKLQEESAFGQLSKVDQALVREIARQYKKEKKIPESLVRELGELTSTSGMAWEAAKKNNDFKSFAPYLEKVFSLVRKQAELIGYTSSPYDVLLDYYEIGMTVEKLDKIFERLKTELVPVIKAIKDSNVKPNEAFLHLNYDRNKQIDLSKAIIKHLGFDFSKGRLDESEHPFMVSIAPGDGRITTHVYQNRLFDGLSSPIHECGHWLYGEGMDPALYKTPLFDGASLGIHESQSRLYETIIGQGLPFWKYFFPVLKHTFPEQLEGVTLDDFYRAINIVEPSFIRIQADELTYQMHIILRYEIEKDLIEGKIKVQDLPQIWNKKMEDYLGIAPKTDSEGILQDVHWSCGLVGYFPTYTLGNLCAAQFYNTARKEIPDLEEKIANGDMQTLRNWLKEKIHKYGKLETPTEILKRVTGEELNPDYFIRYIKEKYSKLYPIKV